MSFFIFPKSSYNLFFLFFISISSRLFSSVFYMEDIDSLRFGLSAFNYDVLENQPHFPGYPLFCFLFNLLYHITGSLGFSASIIGGFSIFVIIVFTQKTCHLLINKVSPSLHFLLLLQEQKA